MCGLVGAYGNLTAKDIAAFREMLIFDSVRGFDSVGVFSLKKNGEEQLVKSIDAVANALETKKFIRALTGDFKLLMGHNRAASVGSVNVNNAHPFDFEHIVGAHNGTLVGWKIDLEDTKNFEVDSECLYHTINKKGIEHTYKKAEGAMALTWYDRRDASINLLRNDDRPLWVASNKAGDVIYWASEPWMISVALGHQCIEAVDLNRLDSHKHLKVVNKEVSTTVLVPFQRKFETWKGNNWGGNAAGSSNNLKYIQGDEIEFEVLRVVKSSPQAQQVNIVCRDTSKPYTQFNFWLSEEHDSEKLSALSCSTNTFTAVVSSNYGTMLRIMQESIQEVVEEKGNVAPFQKAR